MYISLIRNLRRHIESGLTELARSRTSGDVTDSESLSHAVFKHMSATPIDILPSSSSTRRDPEYTGAESGNAFSDSVRSMLAELDREEEKAADRDAFYRSHRNTVMFAR